jgi:hypothetical protein
VENPLRSPSIDARGSPALRPSPRHPHVRSGATPERGGAAPPLSPRARTLSAAVHAPAAAAAPLAVVATNPLLTAEGGGSPKKGAARPGGKVGKVSTAPSPLSVKGRASGISSPTTLRSVHSSRSMSVLDLGAAAEAEEEAEALPGSGTAAFPLAFSNPLLVASARRPGDGTTARKSLRASGGGKGGALGAHPAAV